MAIIPMYIVIFNLPLKIIKIILKYATHYSIAIMNIYKQIKHRHPTTNIALYCIVLYC